MVGKSSYNDKYLNKLHQDILKIMDEVDRICKENNLRYYLMCGSCLGAVRHQGFIPWDDDLDIAMPRVDFDRFIELLQNDNKVLNNSFYLRWVTTEKYYNHSFAKVCLKDTLFQEDDGVASQKAGIFIDIFPLDYCDAYNHGKERKNYLIKILGYCLLYKGSEHTNVNSIKTWLIKIVASLFSNRTIYKWISCIIEPRNVNQANYQVIYATPYPIRKMIFPKMWHGDGKKLLFEGRYYSCPFEAEAYLNQIYGKDFMQLPPENKRKSHYPIRVVFSDGEEMLFERTRNKINYSDFID